MPPCCSCRRVSGAPRNAHGCPRHGLHTIGLAFGVSVCYVVAGSSLWREFIERGYLPTVTWVPALVLLFPLLLPGPPRRMLAATIAAGTATPVMLIVLQINGLVHAGVDAYVSAVVGSVVAVALAHTWRADHLRPRTRSRSLA